MRKFIIPFLLLCTISLKLVAQTRFDYTAITDADTVLNMVKLASEKEFETYLVYRDGSTVTVIYEQDIFYTHKVYSINFQYYLNGDDHYQLRADFKTKIPKSEKKRKKNIVYEIFQLYNNDFRRQFLLDFFVPENISGRYLSEVYNYSTYFRLYIRGKQICEFNIPKQFEYDIYKNKITIDGVIPMLPTTWYDYFHQNIDKPYIINKK